MEEASNLAESANIQASPALVVRLRGGLGNQMFQYACGRALAIKHNRALFVDDSLLMKRISATLRPYYLGEFNINAKRTTVKELSKNKNIIVSIHQTGRGFDKEFGQFIPHNIIVVLDGYWQSESYFESVKQLLREDFIFKSWRPDDASLFRKIIHSNSVCVHVRRTDYLTTTGGLSVLPLDYYQRAIAYLGALIQQPQFFIFSDDIPWCKQHMKFAYPCIYMHEEERTNDMTIMDFGYMAHCHHFIIANSSYSWWAAWLGRNSEKLVVAPQKWFGDDVASAKHIIPAGWKPL